MTQALRTAWLTRHQHRVELLQVLFRHYDRDVEFGDALLELIPLGDEADIVGRAAPSSSSAELDLLEKLLEQEPHERSADQVSVRVFLDAVNRNAATFGLDRVGSDGRAQIVAWCARYLRARASGSLAPSGYATDQFSTARTMFPYQPEVVGVIAPPWQREEWYPESETRLAARARLEAIARAHIQAALDQIEVELPAAHIVRPRRVANLDRDVGWLFRKLRFRESYDVIFHACDPAPGGGVETVRKAIIRVADRLGVDPSGWESGWR